MGELIFIAIVGGIVVLPLFFLVWTIFSITRLQKKVFAQETDIESLQERLTRLQSAQRRLENAVANAVNVVPPTHGSVAAHAETRSASPQSPSASDAASPAGSETSTTTVVQPAGQSDSTSVTSLPITDPAGAASASPAVARSSEMPVVRDSAEPADEDAVTNDLPLSSVSTVVDDDATAVDPREIDAFFNRIGQNREAAASSNLPPRPRREAAATSHPTFESSVPEMSSVDFESMIGGSLMNKAGAFLLIIGLALFLNYSFASLGPMAKLAAASAFSLILLGAGVILEKRSGGNLMSVGLIGGGWAALYLTAFAAHGITATRVVESPLVGMVLLIVVALGMVVHSLRYRSEMATGLAFIFAFAALFVAEVSLFSEVAAIIMAMGMLGIAWFYDWHQLAAAGIILTYGSMLARLNWKSPSATLGPLDRVLLLQSLLVVLWGTYELIGMAFMRRNPQSEEVTRFLFPMNFFAYLFASLMIWPMVKETPVYWLAGLIMVQYIVIGLARGIWCQNPGEAAVEKNRLFMGSCEDSLVIAAGALCYGIWYLLPAPVVVIGWAITGLLLVEVAYRLPWQLMRFIGHFIVTLAFFRVFIANLDIAGQSGGISHRLLTVLPLIFMMLHLYFRTNTELSWEASPTGGTRCFAPAYSYFAVILAGALVRFELGPGLTPPCWALGALLLSGLGYKFKNWHFRRQGLYLGIGAIGYGLGNDWRSESINPVLASPWLIGAATIGLLYACRWLVAKDETPEASSMLSGIDSLRQHIFSLAGSFGLAHLFYVQISGGFLTLAWSLLGSGLLFFGFTCKDRLLRFSGLGLIFICIIKVFLYDARVLEAPLRILAFMCLGAVMIAISWVYTRYKERIEELLK